jgi:hypothetical protein
MTITLPDYSVFIHETLLLWTPVDTIGVLLFTIFSIAILFGKFEYVPVGEL